MSEFGFQSFPEVRSISSFAKPEDLDIRSTVMQAHQKSHGGNERILTYMLREYREPKDFASFVYLSQVQQAEVIKLGAEHLRRNRPRTMGSLYWQLNDAGRWHPGPALIISDAGRRCSITRGGSMTMGSFRHMPMMARWISSSCRTSCSRSRVPGYWIFLEMCCSRKHRMYRSQRLRAQFI